jgi:hypothetical protein
MLLGYFTQKPENMLNSERGEKGDSRNFGSLEVSEKA